MFLVKARNGVLALGICLAAIAALMYMSMLPGVTAAAPRGATLSFDVCVNFDDRTPVAAAATEAFHISGTIFPRGGPYGADEEVGPFDCWGWLTGRGTYVSQEYKIGLRGSIQTQGQELGAITDLRLPVVGGEGDFMGVRGEAFERAGPGVGGTDGCVAAGFDAGFEIDFHILGGLR